MTSVSVWKLPDPMPSPRPCSGPDSQVGQPPPRAGTYDVGLPAAPATTANTLTTTPTRPAVPSARNASGRPAERLADVPPFTAAARLSMSPCSESIPHHAREEAEPSAGRARLELYATPPPHTHIAPVPRAQARADPVRRRGGGPCPRRA